MEGKKPGRIGRPALSGYESGGKNLQGGNDGEYNIKKDGRREDRQGYITKGE